MMEDNSPKTQLILFLKEILRSNEDINVLSKNRLYNVLKSEIIQFIKRITDELTSIDNQDLIKIGDNSLIQAVLDFFSTYYQNKIMISKSNCTDFAQKDIKFQWINSDQYFSQSNDFHHNYCVKGAGITLKFILISKEPEKEGKNKPKLFHFIASKPISVEKNGDNILIEIYFEYKSPSEENKTKYARMTPKKMLGLVNQEILTELNQLFSQHKHIDGLSIEHKEYIRRNLEIYINKIPGVSFIHKNLLDFLTKELEFFIQSILYPGLESNFDIEIHEKVKTIKIFRDLCTQIIVFLAKLENIKKILFLKKKFILKTNYCIPIGFLHPSIYKEIINNKQQIQNWKDNLKITNEFIDDLGKNPTLLKNHPTLYVNTMLFSDSQKNRMMEQFQKENKPIQGIAIKGENFQALKLLNTTYKDSVKCIYIDPPYNTGQDFLYNDSFQRANWLTMMDNRLKIAKNYLSEEGIFFSSIDDNELAGYSLLIEDIFKNRLNNIVWHKKTQPSYLSKELISVTEYILIAKKTDELLQLVGEFGDPNKLTELLNIGNKQGVKRTIPKDHVLIANDWNGTLEKGIYGKTKLQVTLLNGPIVITNGKPNQDLALEGRFKWTQDRINLEINKGGIIHIKSIKSLRPTIKRHYDSPIVKALTTLLSKKVNNLPTNTDANAELKALFEISPFDYSKPIKLIKYLIRAGTYYDKKNANVLDFFAGSGTTAQAVLELNRDDNGNRKYLLMEKEQYFDSVLLPRIQKIVYSSNWNNGNPEDQNGYEHILKFHILEQYEDGFLNIVEKKTDIKKGQLGYIVDFKDDLMPVKLNIQQFNKPFDYKIQFTDNGVIKYSKVDLVQTFNYLLGIQDPRIIMKTHQNRDYRIIIGQMKQKKTKSMIIWRNTDALDLNEEQIFIDDLILELKINKDPKNIYMNSIISVKPANVIESVFFKEIFNEN
jgi:adenine-specific DNA-methyltransferase